MQKDRQRPNILLIMADQWRADCLGRAGHPVVETPNLDNLSRRGVSFSAAYSAVPSCIAARAALFTGMTQAHHGRVGYREGLPWVYDHMLGQTFTDAGYHTQAVGKMHVYPGRNRCGFDQVELHDGFLHAQMSDHVMHRESTDLVDDYLIWARERAGGSFDLMDNGLDCNSWIARPWHTDEVLHPTNWTAMRTEDALRRKDPMHPFFIFSSFHRPHAPYYPPQDYWDMYRDAELPEIPIGTWRHADDRDLGQIVSSQEGAVRPSSLARARRAYYACMTHIDHQLGRILSRLGDTGELHNTIIVFTSDHGDLLGDHHYLRKSSPLEGASRIPLIIYDPTGTLGIPAGTVSDEPVELMDILPTLCSLAGIDIPETCDGLPMDRVLRGERSGHTFIHGEHRHAERSYHMIRHRNGYKYTWFDRTGEEWLFDLGSDPTECVNLLAPGDGVAPKPEDLEMRDRLRGHLIECLKDREEDWVVDGALNVGCPDKDTLEHSSIHTGHLPQ